jgi:hypothetical protein
MRNNGKTLVIDCRGYGSTFDMILFPRVWFLASHNRHGVYLGRRTSEKRWRQREGSGDDDETRVAARVYIWTKLSWGDVGEVHPILYWAVGGVRED